MKLKVKLKVGFEHCKVVQSFSTFAKVARMALGGEEPKRESPKNFLEASTQFEVMMRGTGG